MRHGIGRVLGVRERQCTATARHRKLREAYLEQGRGQSREVSRYRIAIIRNTMTSPNKKAAETHTPVIFTPRYQCPHRFLGEGWPSIPVGAASPDRRSCTPPPNWKQNAPLRKRQTSRAAPRADSQRRAARQAGVAFGRRPSRSSVPVKQVSKLRTRERRAESAFVHPPHEVASRASILGGFVPTGASGSAHL